jgi:hypothetical protein
MLPFKFIIKTTSLNHYLQICLQQQTFGMSTKHFLVVLILFFNHFGNKKVFSGKNHESYLKIIISSKTIRTLRKGKVLLIDGGTFTLCAIIGDQLAELIIQNNWEGIM